MDEPVFVEAQWFTRTDGRAINWIVLHSMEAPEKGSTAEATARYFASGSGGRRASAHENHDDNSTVVSVRDKDVAYAAPGFNNDGKHHEHAGYARQSREDWLDAFSLAMLRDRSAPRVARDCARYGIPARFANADDLVAFRRTGDRSRLGITTHLQCTLAARRLGIKSAGHTDPGDGFPMDLFLEWVQAELAKITGAPAPQPDEEQELMAAKDEIINEVKEQALLTVRPALRLVQVEGDKVLWVTDGASFKRDVGPAYKRFLMDHFRIGPVVAIPADQRALIDGIPTVPGS